MIIYEVGPRDGLQNEKTPIPIGEKLAFIDRLRQAGLREIEATSFVSPKWVPQLGDAADLWPQLPVGPSYIALVPNAKGLERALEVGVEAIAVFTAASDAFTLKNINMTVKDSITEFKQLVGRFRESVPAGRVRGYVSTAFECPYAGRIDPEKVVEVAIQLLEIGCGEISFADTVGRAAPREVRDLCQKIRGSFDAALDHVSWHFHDTNGTAIANVAAALDGIPESRTFDSSAGGLGGCPYAPGAGGNLATEDLVYFLERSGVRTGIDLDLLAQASLPILRILGRQPMSKAQLAALGRCEAASPPT